MQLPDNSDAACLIKADWLEDHDQADDAQKLREEVTEGPLVGGIGGVGGFGLCGGDIGGVGVGSAIGGSNIGVGIVVGGGGGGTGLSIGGGGSVMRNIGRFSSLGDHHGVGY